LSLCAVIFVGCDRREVDAPRPKTKAARQFEVRVLLAEDINNCAVQIEAAFDVVDGTDSQNKLARFERIDSPIEVAVSDEGFTILGNTLGGREIIIIPDDVQPFVFNGSGYRGKLKLTFDSNSKTFIAINIVGLEDYLAGVIGAEMPSYWEAEALKAQTIAARGYCLYIKKRFGETRGWDLRKTQANQAYHGIRAESRPVNKAIEQTLGLVLICGQGDDEKDIFPSYYSSTCGGHTENSEGVFGDSFGPLEGVDCPYCEQIAKPALYSWKKVQLDKDNVARRLVQRYPQLKRLGKITNITVRDKSGYNGFSRVTMVKLTGSAGGSDFLRGEDFRLAIDRTGRIIKSAAFELIDGGDKWVFSNGRGYGHGVGMCQCGAQALARKGSSAEEILRYYYPGSQIKNIYEDE